MCIACCVFQFQCTHEMMLQGKSTLTCVPPESGTVGQWDGDPPQCVAIAANTLEQFEGRIHR